MDQKVQQWCDQAGLDRSRVTYDEGGTALYWVSCGRCSGKGVLPWYGHVQGGVCFSCGGAKGREHAVQKLAERARKRRREAERRVEKARELRYSRTFRARAALRSDPELRAALASCGRSPFLVRIARHVVRYAEVSPGQRAAALRVARELRNTAELREVRPPEGRVEVPFVVLKVYEDEGPWGTTFRMLVRVERDGETFRLLGSNPGRGELEVGARGVLRANVEPVEVGFGYFKRPFLVSVEDREAA